jgi:ribosome biogenesis GTPase A
MAKAIRLIKEALPLADCVIEILDARAPKSSRNEDALKIFSGKKRVIVLNKYDLADEEQSALWKKFYREEGAEVVFANCLTGAGVNDIERAVRNLTAEKVSAQKSRGRLSVTIRAAVFGIPNVGKSSLINRYSGKKSAKTENRPGVTRANKWIKVKKDFEILDTPGILPPKFTEPQSGINAALIGSVKDSVTDTYSLANELLKFLIANYPQLIESRYNLNASETGFSEIALKRGYLRPGGTPDTERCANVLIDEFRAGKIGQVTLDIL